MMDASIWGGKSKGTTPKREHERTVNVHYKCLHASPLQRDVLAGGGWRCSSTWALDRCWSQYVDTHQRLAYTFACSHRKRSEQFDATILGKLPVPFPSQGRESQIHAMATSTEKEWKTGLPVPAFYITYYYQCCTCTRQTDRRTSRASLLGSHQIDITPLAFPFGAANGLPTASIWWAE
jgi:hypothetical protein